MASSLRNHMERTHKKILTQTHGVDVELGVGGTYVVTFPCVLTVVTCLVEGFPERTHNPGWLCKHFMYSNWKAKIAILNECPVPIPRCDNCIVHMQAAILDKHKQTARCDRAAKIRLIRRDVGLVNRSGDVEFSLYGR